MHLQMLLPHTGEPRLHLAQCWQCRQGLHWEKHQQVGCWTTASELLPVYSMMKLPFLMSCRARTPQPVCCVKKDSMLGLGSRWKGLQAHTANLGLLLNVIKLRHLDTVQSREMLRYTLHPASTTPGCQARRKQAPAYL